MRGMREHSKCTTQPSDHCHPLFHAMVEMAGIDLTYTHDPIERTRRALAAIKIAEWVLLEQLKTPLGKQQEETQP